MFIIILYLQLVLVSQEVKVNTVSTPSTLVGLSVLKHVLTPRMKASHVAIESMKEHLDAVYDVTVAYEGTLTADGKRRSAPSMPGTVTHFPHFYCSPKSLT